MKIQLSLPLYNKIVDSIETSANVLASTFSASTVERLKATRLYEGYTKARKTVVVEVNNNEVTFNINDKFVLDCVETHSRIMRAAVPVISAVSGYVQVSTAEQIELTARWSEEAE